VGVPGRGKNKGCSLRGRGEGGGRKREARRKEKKFGGKKGLGVRKKKVNEGNGKNGLSGGGGFSRDEVK